MTACGNHELLLRACAYFRRWSDSNFVTFRDHSRFKYVLALDGAPSICLRTTLLASAAARV